MTRTPLPGRRPAITQVVVHIGAGGVQYEYAVTFGFDDANTIRECFCSSPKDGSDMQAMISDSCIVISKLLQHGESIAYVADAFLENRPEGEKSGPPASPFGAIARAGAALEVEVAALPNPYAVAAQ